MDKQIKTENIWFVLSSFILMVLGVCYYCFLPKANLKDIIIGIILLIVMLAVGLGMSGKYRKINKPEEIPNLWTGLGILFTFISFLFAFGSDDLSIKSLIPKISAAFTTSIVGLIHSKISIYLLKKREVEKEDAVNYKSPETILSSIISVNRDLEATLAKFKTDISQSIINGVEKGLKTTLSETITNLDEKIDKLDRTFDKIINETNTRQSNVKEITGKFQIFIALQEETNEAMEKMLETVLEQLKTIETLQEKRKSDVEFIVNNKDVNAKFKVICDQLAQLQNRVNHV